MRMILKMGIGLVLLLVIGVVVAIFSIDTVAKRSIESSATRVLGVNTSVGSMHIGIMSQDASMKKLAIDNPKGFTDGSFLALGDSSIAVDLKSLMSDVVHVPKIGLNDIEVNLEQKLEGSNVSAILANIKSATSSGGAEKESGRKYVIDTLAIKNVTVNIKTTGLPVVQPGATIKIDSLELKSLGSAGKDPIGLDQLSAIVVDAILKAALEAGASQMPEQLAKALGDGLAGIGKNLPIPEIKLDSGPLKGAGDAIEKAKEDIGKGLEDLLKKK